jgi:type I restriction-modification system DNA methylase subunit
MEYVKGICLSVFIFTLTGYLLKCNDINSIIQYTCGAIAMLVVIELNNKLLNK